MNVIITSATRIIIVDYYSFLATVYEAPLSQAEECYYFWEIGK